MPQMGPLPWLLLESMSITLIMANLGIIYFFFRPSLSKKLFGDKLLKNSWMY